MSSFLTKIVRSGFTKFFIANAFYSASTALITLFSPSFLNNSVYTDFIYLFQMVLFLTGIFTLGLVPGLLRFYKLDNNRYSYYYYITIAFIIGILLSLGFFPQNFLSHALNITTPSISSSLIIYGSTVLGLLFIFNRGVEVARSNYGTILRHSLLIFVVRLALLFLIKYSNVSSPYVVLFLLCVLPFVYEMIIFLIAISKQKRCSLKGYVDFLIFIIKIALGGIIFSATSRLYIISSRALDPTLAASLSFASGLTGIISLFNTTIINVFIGKLDHRDHGGITKYLNKVKVNLFPFLFIAFLLGIAVFAFVVLIYPENSMQASILSSLTVVHCASLSYLGLITLLAKTYNLLNRQIIVNIITYILVWIFVKIVADSLNPYIAYFIINGIIFLMELIFALTIIRYIKKISVLC